MDRIQVLRPLLPDAGRLLSYLRRIDSSRTYSNWGPLASELERRLAAHFGLPVGSVTSANSGTGALVGAILGTAGRASEARSVTLVPAFTFVATSLAAEQCGYRPRFVDIDAESWRVEPDALYGHPLLPRVGLVMPVAPFGRAVPQAPWLEFHRRTGIRVVIDGGASFEAISGDPLQYAGEIPVALSFHATKSFGTGEGGCVITTDRQCAERLGQALNFGFLASRTCEIASTNGKMSEYHAAVGLAELDGWADKAAALRALAREYRQQLDVRRLAHRFVAVPDVASCYALFRCTDDAEVTRVLDSLDASNIDSRHWYGHGLHRHPYYAASPRDRLTVTDGLAPLTIGLPVAPDLPAASVARVVAALARAIGDR